MSVFASLFLVFSFCLGIQAEASSSDLTPSFESADFDHDPIAPIKILSLDGGGIRGLASLEILRAVLDRGCEVPTHLAGTSTGGIIAIGLAHGCSVNELINLYRDHGRDIFRKDGWSAWRSVKSLFREQYTDTGLVAQLHAILGETTKLGYLVDKHVMVTSYDVLGGEERAPRPYIFNSHNPAMREVDLWKAARATSAAPTYFDPYCGLPGHVLIDGGVIANHPGNIALEAIMGEYPLSLRDDMMTHVSMVSIGTGIFNTPLTAEQARGMGKLDWAGPISGVMMAGASALVDHNLRTVLGDVHDGGRYARLQFQLENEIALDGVSPEEVQTLQHVALSYIQAHPLEIDEAAALLRP